MKPDDLNDDQIFDMLVELDNEYLNKGFPIERRSILVPSAMMNKLGYLGSFLYFIGMPSGIYGRIESIYRSMYKKEDFLHELNIGVFMFKDTFVRVKLEKALGIVKFKPLSNVDLNVKQLEIMQKESAILQIYMDQYCDLLDIAYGMKQLYAKIAANKTAHVMIKLAQIQLHAAAAILVAGYDYRGATQSALLATELALKSGAAAIGLTENTIKRRFGHETRKLAEFLGSNWINFDCERVKRVIASQPAYVPNRYSASQPSRRQVGHVAMGAQYIVSEVIRQMSPYNFRPIVLRSSDRVYPT